MRKYEFLQYTVAGRRLQALKEIHKAQLDHAYDGIHPTRTVTDYVLGSINVESIRPQDYTVFLIELQEKHATKERYWKVRAEVFEQMLRTFSEQEKKELLAYSPIYNSNEKTQAKAMKRLRELITDIPELSRSKEVRESIQDINEFDLEIENMSNEELLEGYEDPLEREGIEERCIYLRSTYALSFDSIGERLSVTTSRVSKIITEHGAKGIEEEKRCKKMKSS